MENGKFGGREVVIVEAVRTPVGRGHEEKGYYKDTHPSNLLAKTYAEVIERAGIDASEVEDVVAGCVQQFGEQGINIGRNAWLEAGLPIETPATTVDRQCGSAQQAVNFAAALIASGVHDVAIGGGVEHMGHISFADGFSVMQEHGMRLLAGADGALQPRPAGHLGRDDRRQVGDPPLRARRDRPALPPARRTRRPRRAASSARSSRSQVNGDTYVTDQGIRPDTTPREARRAEAGLQGGRQDHRRQLLADLRRRRRGAADDAARRPTRSGSSRGPGSSTRRPSASTR